MDLYRVRVTAFYQVGRYIKQNQRSTQGIERSLVLADLLAAWYATVFQSKLNGVPLCVFEANTTTCTDEVISSCWLDCYDPEPLMIYEDDPDDDDQPSAPASGYDDAQFTRGDLDRPQGGYPLTDEEDRAECLRVYSEEGDAAVAEFEEHLAMVRERDPPR